MSHVDKMAWQIEMRLHQPLTLHALADVCAVSPYHLSRVFRSATGLSPMAYLRARRLSRAAETLANSDADILTIALDAQYNSHEAFTRAFAGYFGVLPSTVQAARSNETLSMMEPLAMKNELIVDVAAPQIREREAFRVVGMSNHFTFDSISGIPALWAEFNRSEADVPEAVAGAYYGACCDGDGSGRFRYVAGIEAAVGAGLPAGMDDAVIPAGRYAVFTHSGQISDFPKTVYTIWNKTLPDGGFDVRRAPDFERYDHRFDGATGRGDVEVWIPIV